MALDQSIHHYAWALDVVTPSGTYKAATTDLYEDLAVTSLGAFYPKRIKSPDSTVIHALNDAGFGIDQPSRVTFLLDNSEYSGDVPFRSGLKLHLRADAIRGVAAGGSVATWPDISGEGNDATTNNGTVTLQAGIQNDHHACRFNLTAGMTINSALNLSSGYTVAIVYSDRGSPGFRRAIAGVSNNWLIGPYAVSGTTHYQAFNGGFTGGPATVPNVFAIQIVAGDASNCESWVNGTLAGTNASSPTTPGAMGLGISNAFSEPLNGDIAEVLAWNRRFIRSEIEGLGRYLSREYAISGPGLPEGLNAAEDQRGYPARLRHYDRTTGEVVVELQGMVLEVQHPETNAVVTVGSHDDGLFDVQIPTQVVDTATAEFFTAGDPGAPFPVIFGTGVPVRPVFIADDTQTASPIGFDFIAGYGALKVEAVFTDWDPEMPGFEALSAYYTAPGSPTYVSATQFHVSGSQNMAYGLASDSGGTIIGGFPFRAHTTATGTTAYAYSSIKSYTNGTVAIADAILDAGISGAEIGGDYLVIRDGYTGVTVNAASGATADFTALRLYDLPQSGVIAQVSNAGTTNPATCIAAILSDPTWGLSSVTQQSLNGASFVQAGIDFSSAGLGSAIQGALGGDRSQRIARDVLNEMLMMRGARLTRNLAGEWLLPVDTAPSASTLSFELGPGTKNNIKRVNSFGYVPLGQAVRNVVIAFEAVGRARDKLKRFVPSEYRQRATVAASGRGADRIITSPWIRTQSVAGRVAYYLAKRLAAADRPLSITVGQEGRQLTVGQLVRIRIPARGVESDWQVMQIQRSLIETTLLLHRIDPAMYTYDAAQVVFTDAPDPSERRFKPGTGGNLIVNSRLGAPFIPVSANISGTLTTISPWPSGVDIAGAGTITAMSSNYNLALKQRSIGGNYVEASFTGVAAGGIGIRMTTHNLKASTAYLVSAYCSASEGIFFQVEYFLADTSSHGEALTTVADPTDVSPNGHIRHYARFRTRADYLPTAGVDSGGAAVSIMAITGGTYRYDAPLLEEWTARNVRPSPWKPSPPAYSLMAQGNAVTLAGKTRAALLTTAAGSTLLGATVSVSGSVSHPFNVGIDGDATLWGNACTKGAVGQRTDTGDFADGGSPVHFATPTIIYIERAGGGTFTSGTVTGAVEYWRASPPTVT